MILLAIDTTAESIILALKKDDKEDFFVSEKGAKKHNSVLLRHIDAFLAKNGLTIRDLDYFGVVVGPGSFTGIRVGVATVNAFAFATGKKIVEATSLEIPYCEKDGKTMVTLDCKHANFYCGIFEEGKSEYLALTEEEVASYDCLKIRAEEATPSDLLRCCVEKAKKGEFCTQAKPFYLKKSSAEREKGL